MFLQGDFDNINKESVDICEIFELLVVDALLKEEEGYDGN